MKIIDKRIAYTLFVAALTACGGIDEETVGETEDSVTQPAERPVSPPATTHDTSGGSVENRNENIMLRGVRVTREWMPYSSTSGWSQAVPKGFKESESLKFYEFAIWEETESIHLYAFDNEFDPLYSLYPGRTSEQSIAYREAHRVMRFDNMPPESEPLRRSTFLKDSLTQFANYMVSMHPDAGHHLMYSGHGGPGGGLFELQLTPEDAGGFLKNWSDMLGRNLGVVDMGGPCNKGSYADIDNFCRYADYYVASDLSNGGYTFDQFTGEKYNETSQEIQYHDFFKQADTLGDVLKRSLDTRFKRYEYSRNNMITNKVEQSSYVYNCRAFPTFKAAFSEFAAGRRDYSLVTDMQGYLQENNAPEEVMSSFEDLIDYKIDNRSFFPWEVEANGLLMLYPSNL